GEAQGERPNQYLQVSQWPAALLPIPSVPSRQEEAQLSQCRQANRWPCPWTAAQTAGDQSRVGHRVSRWPADQLTVEAQRQEARRWASRPCSSPDSYPWVPSEVWPEAQGSAEAQTEEAPFREQ